MPDDFDFYATPNPKEDEGSQEFIELPLTRAKSITRNRALTFFILVVFSLGLSLWLLFSNDWKAYLDKKNERSAQAEVEEAMVQEGSSKASVSNALEVADSSLGDYEVSGVDFDERIDVSRLKLFPGTHKITFRPETAKEEGLSLFYVRGKKDVPESDVFKFEESKVRLVKSNEELLTKTEDVIETKLDPVEMFISVGEHRLELGDQTQALVAFARVLALDPNHKQALEISAMLNSELEQFDEAEVLLERLADLEPKNAEVRNNLAVIFLRSGREADALTQLEMALDVDPNYFDAKINMALVLLSRGSFRDVEDLILPEYKQGSRNVSILTVLAKAFGGQGKWVVARTYLEQLIELKPLPEYYHTIARSYLIDGESNRSLQWLFRGNNKYPDGSFAPYLSDPIFEDLKNRPGARRLFSEQAQAPAN